MKRGYFGIGIYGSKTPANVGTLWRSAANFGAAFIFTVGKRYPKQASDTVEAWKHIPLFEVEKLAELPVPKGCPVASARLRPPRAGGLPAGGRGSRGPTRDTQRGFVGRIDRVAALPERCRCWLDRHVRPPSQGAMIPAAKIEALRQALERDGEVVFKNGSKVERVVSEGLETDENGTNWVSRIHFLVTRPMRGAARFTDSELHRAYEMALDGPRPKEQPRGDPSKYGGDPPW